MAIAIRPAINAYSIAVAPASSRRNLSSNGRYLPIPKDCTSEL